ncbi:MAG: 6-carboxytetrahydropterin synthase [Bacteroidales bacterium]|jgi:6-pyruvoyltetrahydropterin/6-carboxytetrahydropterin synthase|nr:6-carboxytetrahydropterin synthase [Bacteroidales bacterium]
MAKIRLTKVFSYAMAHALDNYDGLCKNIHGHNYHLEVTVSGIPVVDTLSPKKGMLIDFSDLKTIINREIVDVLDHALMLNDATNPELISLLKKTYERVIMVPFQPTTENMLCYLADTIQKVLPEGVLLYSLKLKETENSYAEWYAIDNE